MALIVQKFGGSSVANAERIMHVAEIITNTYRNGNDVVAVLSAQGDTTDDLIEKAAELNPNASKREMDMLLSTGEQVSMTLLAMAIEALGYKSISFTGRQAGIETNGTHNKARIVKVHNERIMEAIAAGAIPVVAGFQGIDANGDITTLGRGGSDTTAVALAVFLHADLCQIYTDVDGVYDKDPRLYPDAMKFDWISYEKMRRLIAGGAQVLHDRSVELAQRFGLAIEVLSSFTGQPGTIVCAEESGT